MVDMYSLQLNLYPPYVKKIMNFNWHTLSSPEWFYRFAGKLMPWLAFIAVLLFAYGLIGGLLFAPADYQQGDGFRIIYIHVPSAILSMQVYAGMAVCAIVSLIWRIKLADVIVRAAAPVGAWFTVLALVTGSIWGKPMWGTWWVWDARLTSELLLLFLYLGYMALYSAFADTQKAAKVSNILLLVGAIDLPIIHYSVQWWNTLHQSDTINLMGKSHMAASMLHPLLAMMFAFMVYTLLIVLMRARTELLQRGWRSRWARAIISREGES
tara:strand:- start:6761 stop:7564 length:804 start_codon:yes stop_codon:yes gene_type:complete